MPNYTVTTSAELMENYLQADFLLPQDKLIALQTDGGAALLFSIGTGGAFYLTLETPGQAYGFRQVDLAAAQIKADFGGNATVKTFGAAQRPAAAGAAAAIQLAMVVSDGTNDHLYISLGNSDADLSWADRPVWVAAPFNALAGDGSPITPPSPFQIENTFVSEATDREYLVVDTIRNPGQSAPMLARYYLDGSSPGAPTWKPHDLSIDVQAEGYDSCLGRSAQAFGVDGLYTKGVVGSSAQLIYTPLYNAFDPALPPLPSRLNLPGGLIADAIAAARNADNSSDLYAAAQGALYWFSSTNQKDGASAVLVAQSPLLAAVHSLYASVDGDALTVWGLNGNDQVFYLTCPIGQQASAGAWSTPLPILTGVDAISPFVDRAYSANTFFAHSGTGLLKLMKSPASGLWTQRPVTLPPSVTTKPATPIHSYSTHIQVTDASGRAAANVAVKVTATNVTSVYINHLYYMIGPSPIELVTDALGTITIVEIATTLAGTRFSVTVDSQAPTPVNTMDSAWQRNAKYTTADSLRAAQIVSRDGSSRDFIPAGTSTEDLERVAFSNQCLAKAYTSVSSTTAPPAPALRAHARPQPAALAAASIGEGILVDIGDLFSYLESGVGGLIQLVEDAVDGAWHFVVSIGDAVYHAVLDCVEAVVAAATWVYNEIKIAVDDVIQFLEFLFGWQDILVTHKVLKNVVLRLSQQAIDGIDTTKAQAIALFSQLQTEINSWAGIPDFNQTATSTIAANPPLSGQNSAPANLGVHHFQGGCAASSSSLSATGVAESIFGDLITLLQAEGDTLSAAANAIKTDIVDQFSSLGVADIIKRFIAILADTLLQSAENVIVTMLNVFKQLMAGMMDVLTAKLDIPILSWLYDELTGEHLSFLDLLCLVAAIPVTIVYKATAQKAPFASSDAFTQGLLGAQSWSDVQAQFVSSSPEALDALRAPMMLRAGLTAADAGGATASTDPDPAVLDQAKLKTFGFVTGLVSLVGSIVLVVVVNAQRALDVLKERGIGISKGLSMTLATIACLGNIAYVSPNIATLVNAKTGNWYANMNNAITLISIIKGIAAIPAAAFDNPVIGKVFAFVETFINVVWNVPVIANIVVNKNTWNTTYKSLIPESIGNFSFNVGGILEFPIALVSDPKAKGIMILTQAGLMLVYGTCMSIAGGIYQFAPNQSH